MRIIYLFHLITSLVCLESWGTLFGIAQLANGFDSCAISGEICVRYGVVTPLDSRTSIAHGCAYVITVVLAIGDDLLGFSFAE